MGEGTRKRGDRRGPRRPQFGDVWKAVAVAEGEWKWDASVGEDAKQRMAMRPGNSFCPECGDPIFARLDWCRSCGARRPVDSYGDEAAEVAEARAAALGSTARTRRGTRRQADNCSAVAGGDSTVVASRCNQPALHLVLGKWADCKGSSHEVTLDEDGKTCSVSTTRSSRIRGFPRPGRRSEGMQERKAYIHVDADGWVCWGLQSSYYLDVDSASETRVQWNPAFASKAFTWQRIEQTQSEPRSGLAHSGFAHKEAEQDQDEQPEEEETDAPEKEEEDDETDNTQLPASVPSPSPASSTTGTSTEHSRSSGGSSHGKLLPHFCIFQGDGHGISGWTRENGSRKNRWDTILLSLLQCVMMDGEWPREVKASAFVGADAIHINGAIQRIAMPVLGYRENGSKRYGPATVCDWEEMLWEQYGVDSKGLRWELSDEPGATRHASQETLLRRLEKTLDAAPRDSIAIILDAGADANYEELKMLGRCRSSSETRTVFLVLGGAHGFDGRNDADGELLKAILGRFRRRLGPERVLAVDLCERTGRPVKLTASKVAAFLSCEHARGTLAHVVSGVEARVEAAAKVGAN